MIRLSILIPTTSSRDEIIKPLLEDIRKQIVDGVELIINKHESDCIGKKRNDLLQMSHGDYIVFVDSDDHIADNYVDLILKSIESNPDCVGICGVISTNGADFKNWFISMDYTHWYEFNNCYFRTPNHISPIRRELAIQIGFPEISFGEDAEYSKNIKHLLNTEVKINEPIYHYDFKFPK